MAADIFEIKGVNAELKVNGKTYRFADPKFKDKILLQKELKSLKSKEGEMDPDDLLLAQYEMTKKMVKQYVPTIEDAILDEMGDFALMALLEELNSLAEKKFGATVSKVEGK